MPELPEVQTMVNDLVATGIVGREIDRVRVHWPASIVGMPSIKFCHRVKGRRINAISRRGKYILFHLDNTEIVACHLRMTGRFIYHRSQSPRTKHVQMIVRFDNGSQLSFHDTRKFGRISLVTDWASFNATLGLEPLEREFTWNKLTKILKERKRQLKPLLLDQKVIAGLGNIYADEALWAASIHPKRNSESLSLTEVQLLHRKIRYVLRQGLKHSGTSLGSGSNNFRSLGNTLGRNGSNLKVYGRVGQSCPRCSRAIERIQVGQRSSHICPGCQPDGFV